VISAIRFRSASSSTATNSQGWRLMADAASRPQSMMSSTIFLGTAVCS
jgi:hypothetical protein